MAGERRSGAHTIDLSPGPAVAATGSVVGPVEGQGPLGGRFDRVMRDSLMGHKSWEAAEAWMLEQALKTACRTAGLEIDQVHCLIAGDLLNQITAAGIAARGLSVPFLGIYSACATVVQSLALAGLLVGGGFAGTALAGASSHHDTAERQYRMPTEYGGQRSPTAQWTATAAGALVVTMPPAAGAPGPLLERVTFGRVVDMGFSDTANMGAAMAPAAADTILRHLADTGRRADAYDLILTGDLGGVGSTILHELLAAEGMDLTGRYADAGLMLYDPRRQDVHAGGSGAGCVAAVLAGVVVDEMRGGTWGRVLVVGTGALFSPTTTQQGETVPAVAHAVSLIAPGREKGGTS